MEKIFLIFGLILLTLIISPAQAQDSDLNGRNKYYKVEELIKLIEKSREAGMSDEALQKLEIRDGDQEINVYEYIEKEKLEKLRKEKHLKELLNKKFLTVNDIYRELIKTEPDVIQKLREDLVSER